ncbi:hypothetical protein EW146_g10439 [Bondarzewia mesenterica]|uniref:CCHC-type domain-containing protein n=1 Tax=Bondarzewia mesenterica TaxID=1095465 RepID=A0A4S4KXB9_9AGAM|nr:hypothetical protein EW146_g10439 [Bondarzewia mesenterica]
MERTHIDALGKQIEQLASDLAGNCTPSYWDALAKATTAPSQATPPPPPGVRQHARIVAKACQILVDALDPNSPPPLDGISLDTSRNDANKAIISIVMDLKANPSFTVTVRQVTCTKTGALLLELGSAEGAEWLGSWGRRFSAKLGAGTHLHPCLYSVLVKFTPLSLRLVNTADLREIKEVNGLAEDSIISARWVKLVHHRSPSQKCTHAILAFSSPTAANAVLAGGLFICHTKLWPEKLRKEPIRCLKCQRYGHMAVQCLEAMDTCGTCGKGHRTMDCNDKEPQHYVSCDSSDHTSWSRNCPTFSHLCDGLDANHVENTMFFFPT